MYACLGIDHALLDVERYDLDPIPRLRIFEAQNSTRVEERSSVEQRAATYVHSIFKFRFPNFFSDFFFLPDFSMFVALNVPQLTIIKNLALVTPK